MERSFIEKIEEKLIKFADQQPTQETVEKQLEIDINLLSRMVERYEHQISILIQKMQREKKSIKLDELNKQIIDIKEKKMVAKDRLMFLELVYELELYDNLPELEEVLKEYGSQEDN